MHRPQTEDYPSRVLWRKAKGKHCTTSCDFCIMLSLRQVVVAFMGLSVWAEIPWTWPHTPTQHLRKILVETKQQKQKLLCLLVVLLSFLSNPIINTKLHKVSHAKITSVKSCIAWLAINLMCVTLFVSSAQLMYRSPCVTKEGTLTNLRYMVQPSL